MKKISKQSDSIIFKSLRAVGKGQPDGNNTTASEKRLHCAISQSGEDTGDPIRGMGKNGPIRGFPLRSDICNTSVKHLCYREVNV